MGLSGDQVRERKTGIKKKIYNGRQNLAISLQNIDLTDLQP